MSKSMYTEPSRLCGRKSRTLLMRTDDLIQQLVSDLRPVRPQWTPLVFVTALSATCFLGIGLGLAFGLRPDWLNQLIRRTLWLDLSLSLALVLSSLSLVGWLSSPGRG